MYVSIPVAIALILLAGGLIWRATYMWWKYRGDRVIVCPENHQPAGVQVDALRVAARPFTGNPALELSSCSRWPERAGCGRECLGQIEAAPEGCLVRNILLEWYTGKWCVSCGQPFGEISPAGAKPAVLRADEVSVEWSMIPADRLAETLADGLPICFACHMSNVLVREHPELVVDRHRTADRGRH